MMTTKTEQAQETQTLIGEVKGQGKTYTVTMQIPALLTGELWCNWWDRRAEILDGKAANNSAGTNLRSKYLAWLDTAIQSGNYRVEGEPGDHDLKTEGMKAPAVIVQWVNLQLDELWGEVWEVPQPASGRQPKRG